MLSPAKTPMLPDPSLFCLESGGETHNSLQMERAAPPGFAGIWMQKERESVCVCTQILKQRKREIQKSYIYIYSLASHHSDSVTSDSSVKLERGV